MVNRWFAYCPSDRCLRYWPSQPSGDVISKGTVDLRELERAGKILIVKDRVIHLVEDNSGRVTKLRCSNKADADRWLTAFEGTTNRRRQQSDAPEFVREAGMGSESPRPASPPEPPAVARTVSQEAIKFTAEKLRFGYGSDELFRDGLQKWINDADMKRSI